MRPLLLLILLIGVLGDGISTFIAFQRHGCYVERNPITRTLCYHCSHGLAVLGGSLWEFIILYLFLKLYEMKANVLKDYFMFYISLLPYIAVVNNIVFLLTH